MIPFAVKHEAIARGKQSVAIYVTRSRLYWTLLRHNSQTSECTNKYRCSVATVSDIDNAETHTHSCGVVTRARPDSICFAVVVARRVCEAIHKYERDSGILSWRAGLNGRTEGNVKWTVFIVVQIEASSALPLQINGSQKNQLPMRLP
jgi:hypothetical protein